MFIIFQSGNKTSIQPILKSNFTSFMFNKIFCEIYIKKVSHLEWRNHPNSFLEVELQYLLGYPSILLAYPSNIHTFMPSIGSWCGIINLSIIHVIYTALLKRDTSGHFKAYSSHCFQPKGTGLASLCKGNACVYPIISVYR